MEGAFYQLMEPEVGDHLVGRYYLPTNQQMMEAEEEAAAVAQQSVMKEAQRRPGAVAVVEAVPWIERSVEVAVLVDAMLVAERQAEE